ncbi:MAG: hypothetical protein OEM39_04255 [Acidimicrobiia bacterium]|nr:hypothetical protein [Acidimicrobiia bacterium]
MTAVLDLITGRQFLIGIGLGLVGLTATYLLRHKKADWGLIWTGSGLVAVAFANVGRFRFDAVFEAPWAFVPAILAAAVAASGVMRLKNDLLVIPALAVTLGGIWATLPDTEKVGALLGVSAVLVWGWVGTGWSRPRLVGAFGFGLLTALAVLYGGLSRDTALIGGLGSLASLGLCAFVLPASKPAVWIPTHLALVLVWSRWAGLSNSLMTALGIGLVASALAVAIGYFAGETEASRAHQPSEH